MLKPSQLCWMWLPLYRLCIIILHNIIMTQLIPIFFLITVFCNLLQEDFLSMSVYSYYCVCILSGIISWIFVVGFYVFWLRTNVWSSQYKQHCSANALSGPLLKVTSRNMCESSYVRSAYVMCCTNLCVVYLFLIISAMLHCVVCKFVRSALAQWVWWGVELASDGLGLIQAVGRPICISIL